MMGIEHIRNIMLIPDARLVAVADTNDRSRSWAVAAAPGLTPYADYREMLAGEDIDAVILATPNHTHTAVLKDLLQTNMHILCEKPCAPPSTTAAG